ncbi:hypothetical protein [uncultured Cedecea sp.]|uniref:hypothetical protein n=1 Tax=uncultured Cedecea sp. TaxID=988762 RepID=UPI00261D384D|nr:hypothetical protein [uncultured Cedecea sp.]
MGKGTGEMCPGIDFQYQFRQLNAWQQLPLMAWIALSPLLLMHNLGLSKLHYALWQLPIFGAIIAGNITLNFIAEKFKIERLLLLSAFPVFFGLILSLILNIAV